jgi:hypothetical protein
MRTRNISALAPLGRLLSSAAVASLLGVSPAFAADTTYNVDEPVGVGSIVGQIETNGDTGVLSKADILNWSLIVTGNGASTSLVSGSSTVLLEGADLTATPTQLLFNFSGTDGGYLGFQANNPGVFSGNKYACFNTISNVCKPGESAVPGSVFDPSAVFVIRSGNQVIGEVGGASANAALQASIEALAQSRAAQMLIAQLESQLLLGLNEQVSCGNCGGGGVGFGSFAISGHGRYALTRELTLMGGVDVGQYQEREADVTLNAGFAGALQYDPDIGPSRPYLEVGLAAGLQNARYTRGYALGPAVMTGVGQARNYDVSVYAEPGWVDRFTPRDEGAVYVNLSRSWQMVGGYAEQSGADNPLAATVPAGTDVMDVAGLHAQYTHLFGQRLEAGINGGVNWAFHTQSGLQADIAGGEVEGAQPQFVSYEVGGRVGVRVSRKLTVDLFANAELAPRAIGSSVHGGLDARWTF